jgi:CRP-like cAMP-binding protein/DNA-binding NarL/FixJ family response regulator
MSHKILVIEDNVEMCQNIASILKLGRYDVLTSNTGKLGIELAQQDPPDLILCDIMMPELDGYGVLHILSKDPGTSNIPFIFLTAKTEMRDFRTGMNLGADDYITKPFDGLELLNVIELRLKKNDLIKTTFRNTITDIGDFIYKTKQLPNFHKLSDQLRSRVYKKKEFVFVEGEQPKYVYFVDKGLVKTFKSTNEGKELITGLHGHGDFFGFVSLLEDKPANESAIVMKESQIYMIPQQDFLTLIYANKEIARKFISMLASNLYEAENKLLELAYQSVRQRVATVLLKLNSQTDSTNGDHNITVARKDLSGLVGTTTESLNRTLVDFKNEGLIEIFDKSVKIVQHSKLERERN